MGFGTGGFSSDMTGGSVAGSKLASGLIKYKVFTGNNGAGNITVSGLAAGDRVQSVINLTDEADATASFTSPVATANTLAQSSASDLSAKKFLAVLLPASA